MKRVALFSGSFNPIHIGHTAIANYICEYENIDEVWFVVSPQSPFKQDVSLEQETHRINMVQRAIEGYSKFKLCNIELKLPRPSYTITTLDSLHKQYPNTQFVLMIGEDNWSSFDKWKEFDRIIQEYGLIIYPRREKSESIQEQKLPANVYLCKAPIIEVSSTFIRNAIFTQKNLYFYLSAKVYEYIKEHSLYQ